MKNRRLKAILLTALILLIIPLIAMQFTTDVNWSVSDFLIMGVLLMGTGLLLELVLRKVQKMKNRIILSAAVLVAFFIIWAELAVGIFGTPLAGS